MKNKIKIFISEIRGVWTDAGFFMDASGNEYQKFSFRDFTGLDLLQRNGIDYLLISSDQSSTEEKVMKNRHIKNFKNGLVHKEKFLEDFLKKQNIKWSEVAYIGSDKEDIHLLKKAGLSAVPQTAPFYVKSIAHWTMRRGGGAGVFCEFVEDYLEEIGMLKKSLFLD